MSEEQVRAALGDALREPLPAAVTTVEAVVLLAKMRDSAERNYGRAVRTIVRVREMVKEERCGLAERVRAAVTPRHFGGEHPPEAPDVDPLITWQGDGERCNVATLGCVRDVAGRVRVRDPYGRHGWATLHVDWDGQPAGALPEVERG